MAATASTQRPICPVEEVLILFTTLTPFLACDGRWHLIALPKRDQLSADSQFFLSLPQTILPGVSVPSERQNDAVVTFECARYQTVSLWYRADPETTIAEVCLFIEKRRRSHCF